MSNVKMIKLKMLLKRCNLPNTYLFFSPPVFSSIPLHSAIFTINRKIIIGLVSSIITAAMGYGIRLIILKYLEYDIFINLDN